MKWARRTTAVLGMFLVVTSVAGCSAPAAPAADAPAGTTAAAAPASAPAGKPNTLTAVKVDAASLDAAADYWGKAPVTAIATKATEEDEPDGPAVNLQAVYDDQNFAVRLEWADTTESNMNKAWTWDGTQFTRSKDLGDRMGLLFAMENNPEFASKGCATACHNAEPDPAKWWMGSEDAAVHYDLWQWTAASTNPIGQAQDEVINVLEDPADVESATHGDVLESGGSLSNVNEAKDGPAYMNGTDVGASFIITGEQVPIDTSKLASGALIPTSVLAPWVGSRGDVQAQGTWQDGKWVVVLMRALDTGHDDDLAMTPPKPYPFGVAVFDHIDLEGHTTSPEAITLEWQ